MAFAERVACLPVLGLGISTEHGAAEAPGALDPAGLRRGYPAYAQFLEVGVETAKGLDLHSRSWAAAGWPATYHFLDLNLDEPEDLDAGWLAQVKAIAAALRPAWLCGDAGLWHFGRRERGHMLLLPPILCDDAASALAEGVVRLREATGLEVLPENPPGSAFVGPLHILDFFARVADRADTGLLVDAAHLAMYQQSRGLPPLAGFDGFPCDRVVEIHVAGGSALSSDGLAFTEDDHGPDVLPETWTIAEHLAARCRNLRAVVLEAERNPQPVVLPLFARLAALLRTSSVGATLEAQPA